MTLASFFTSMPSDSTDSLFINDSQLQATQLTQLTQPTQLTHFLLMIPNGK